MIAFFSKNIQWSSLFPQKARVNTERVPPGHTISKGKGAHEPKAHTATAYFPFPWHLVNLEVLLPPPPLDGMLVHRRVTPQQYVAGTHLYTRVKRDKLE